MKWLVYIIECRNNAFYTGVTKNIPHRMDEHKKGLGGKYTRAFGFKRLVYQKRCANRSAALKYEARIKQMTRSLKEGLVKCKKTA